MHSLAQGAQFSIKLGCKRLTEGTIRNSLRRLCTPRDTQTTALSLPSLCKVASDRVILHISCLEKPRTCMAVRRTD